MGKLVRMTGSGRFALGLIVCCLSPLGFDQFHVVAQESSEQSDAESLPGRWRITDNMRQRREYPGGIALPDGRVLAVSGHPLGGRSIASCEVYDPQSGRWTAVGSLRQARNTGNGAILLADGRVLIAGGHTDESGLAEAEIFSPQTGKWSLAGKLSVARDPVLTRLADGRVLASGGIDWSDRVGRVFSVAELFDPKSLEWTVTGSLTIARTGHRFALLETGQVLVVGGYGEKQLLLASAELYDSTDGTWNLTGALPQPRAWFSLTLLADQRVLIAGGYTGQPRQRTYLSSAMIYNPRVGVWRDTQPMQEPRAGFAMTLLSDGRVLVTGGVSKSGGELTACEVYDPENETWQSIKPMEVPRRNHRATLLPDGSVLVMGGSSHFGSSYLSSCEILSLP